MNKEKIKPLFGLPVYHNKLDSNTFEKKKIIKTILSNFKKSKIRNNWVTSEQDFSYSRIHHSYQDIDNKNFKIPDCSSLIPIYTKEIQTYFNQMNMKKINFKFEIVNYTCMSKGHYMQNHIHTDCEFSGVHYLKLKNKSKYSTIFHNKNDYAKFVFQIYPKLCNSLVSSDEKNSWAYQSYRINTEEDDLVIFPAMLEHSVPEIKEDETRISIVFNIQIV
jgi:uncharacterized protein (TIGR02466 family)